MPPVHGPTGGMEIADREPVTRGGGGVDGAGAHHPGGVAGKAHAVPEPADPVPQFGAGRQCDLVGAVDAGRLRPLGSPPRPGQADVQQFAVVRVVDQQARNAARRGG